MVFRNQRLIFVAFLINAILLLLGGMDHIEQGKLLIGCIELAGGTMSLILIRKVRRPGFQLPRQLGALFNALIFIYVGIDYMQEGKTYLPYVWLLAASFSLLVLCLSFRKTT